MSSVRAESKSQYRAQRGTIDNTSLVVLGALILLYGVLISAYVFVVRHETAHTSSAEAVPQAAIYLATALANASVDDPVFGKVGLIDVEPTQTNPVRITSLNRLYATVRLDSMIAKRSGLSLMSNLANEDLQRLHSIQKRLSTTLTDGLRSNLSPQELQTSKNWFAGAWRIVGNASGGHENLVNLKVTLGSLGTTQFRSQTPGTAGPADDNILVGSDYKTGIKIPSGDNDWVSFYQVAPQVRVCDGNTFVPTNNIAIPSVVQLEAMYRISQGIGRPAIAGTRVVYAIVGGVKKEQQPTLLMVSFPHGMPPTVASLRDLVIAKGRPGDWQQATGGAVPGPGHLAAPIVLDNHTMTAGDAIQLVLYHWLRSLGPEVRIEQVVSLLDRSWAKLEPTQSDQPRDPIENGPNSALAKDTGARAFALLYQSGPSGIGQAALKSAFEASNEHNAIPHSAIPLQVDTEGRCNICGQIGYDGKLLADFLAAIHDTNLACIESKTIAASIVRRLQLASDQVKVAMDSSTEELNSVKLKLQQEHTLGQPSEQVLRQIKSLENSQHDLETLIHAQDKKLNTYATIIGRANIVIANAEQGGQDTFELAAHMDRYGREGIVATRQGPGQEPSGFVLSRENVFLPQRKPASEEEIYRPTQKQLDTPQFWLNRQMEVLSKIAVPLDPPATNNDKKTTARFIIFDSRLLSGRHSKLLVLSHSPFADSGIPNGQLSFYAQDSLRSGTVPQVGWSVLIRDLVADRTTGGIPILSPQEAKWFTRDDWQMTVAPALAEEVQVRSPIPMPQDLPEGSSIINPATHEHVLQIPPIPPNML